MRKVTATYIYENYADNLGLIELKVLEKFGWTVKEAEKEGLVIKENYNFNKNTITSVIRYRRSKGVKNARRINKKAKVYNKTFWYS